MPALTETFSMSGYQIQNVTFAIRQLILLIIGVLSWPAEAQASIYVFIPDQSAVIQTGDIAGVHETYGIDDIWWILDRRDYPRLRWELIEGESTALAENLSAGQ